VPILRVQNICHFNVVPIGNHTIYNWDDNVSHVSLDHSSLKPCLIELILELMERY
jgi:hypothetical protein